MNRLNLALMLTLFSASLAQAAPEMPTSSQQLAARKLPDVLSSQAGEKVTTPAQWKVRRAETLELFRTHVYGRAPIGRPENLKFTIEKTDANAMNGAATLKQIAIEYASAKGSGKINLVLFVPNNRRFAAPAFLFLNNRDAEHIDATRQQKSDFWPAETFIERGYAAAAIMVSDIDPDNDDGFKNGAHGLFDAANRGDNAWGTLAAWAWGASRVMDYLQSDNDIDARRVAIVGHSRGGKAALWAGAQDERFALTISNNSGQGGAAISRGKSGETIANINKNFPHWFARNYRNFNNRENDLPLDQHQLIALMAPRLVYIASGQDDAWADPNSEWLSGVAASSVYELLGQKGLTIERAPQVNQVQHEGSIGYHIRPGGHGLKAQDWARFMDFADAKMK